MWTAAVTASLMLAALAHAGTEGYWRFEEGTAGSAASGTGTIVDSSGNGNSGTPIDGPLYSSDVPVSTVPATGATDKLSMSFNGTNQRIFIPDSSSLAITQSLTLEAYIKPLSATSGGPYEQEQIVFRGDDRGGYDPYQLFKQNGNLVFEVTDASNDSAEVTAPLPAIGQWMYVGGTLDDSTGNMDLYINDNLVASTTTSIRPYGTLESNENPGLGIGNVESSTYSEYFDGLIDEVRISNAALAPSQLLDAVPEPASLGIFGGFIVLMYSSGRRPRRAQSAAR
jgi:hypothetical protein